MWLLCRSVRWLLMPSRVAESQIICPPFAMDAIAWHRWATAPLYSLTFSVLTWTPDSDDGVAGGCTGPVRCSPMTVTTVLQLMRQAHMVTHISTIG